MQEAITVSSAHSNKIKVSCKERSTQFRSDMQNESIIDPKFPRGALHGTGRSIKIIAKATNFDYIRKIVANPNIIFTKSKDNDRISDKCNFLVKKLCETDSKALASPKRV